MLTSSDAAHLLRRVGFGGSDAEITHFTGMTRTEAVDEILDATVSLPSAPSWIHNPNWWEVRDDSQWWWFDRMVNSRWTNRSSSTPSPLVEKMALFWHSHFATGVSKVEDMSACFHQIQAFRRYGLGDFEILLKKITYHDHPSAGALLRYLDNDTNGKDNPQENFARELMELYTIGPDEFTEQDVVEMARAWTGHGIVGWVGYWDATYEYHVEVRDNTYKSLWGLTPRNWGARLTCTELTKGAKQDATARFLVGKLWRYFVSDVLPTSVRDALVEEFTPSMDISTLLRAMFLRDEFWAASTRWNLVRSPTEFIADLCRRTGLTPSSSGLEWLTPRMGQELFEPPSVAGWGTHGYWVSTMDSWGRSQFLSHVRWQQTVRSNFTGIMNVADAEAGANMIIDTIGLRDVSTRSREALEQWWLDTDQPGVRWSGDANAVVVGALTPEFLLA